MKDVKKLEHVKELLENEKVVLTKYIDKSKKLIATMQSEIDKENEHLKEMEEKVKQINEILG